MEILSGGVKNEVISLWISDQRWQSLPKALESETGGG